MITHFDMITGQPIADVQPNERSDTCTTAVPTPTLRMLTVQESIGAQHKVQRIPTAIAGLPVGELLDRWQ